jgi:DNA-binding CsgD family transcriptional regulator
VRSSTVKAGLALRARIVLLAADGVSNTEIARRMGGVAADGDRVAVAV